MVLFYRYLCLSPLEATQLLLGCVRFSSNKWIHWPQLSWSGQSHNVQHYAIVSFAFDSKTAFCVSVHHCRLSWIQLDQIICVRNKSYLWKSLTTVGSWHQRGHILWTPHRCYLRLRTRWSNIQLIFILQNGSAQHETPVKNLNSAS
jgi:hypothetical protein